MKILHESYSELKLKRPLDKRFAFFVLFWGSGFIGMPLFMMALLLQQFGILSLQCDRPQPEQITCEKQQTSFAGLFEQPAKTYSGVTGAALRTQTGQDDDGYTTYEYWVTLDTDQGLQTLLEAPIMINGVKGDRAEMGAIAQQLSQFVQSEQPRLAITQDNSLKPGLLLPLGVMSTFPLIGGALAYFVLQSEELLFDRERGLLQRHRKTLLGSQRQDVPLHDIQDTEIRSLRGQAQQYQLKLLPKSLKTAPLMISRDRAQVLEIEAKVQQFLQSSRHS